MIMTRSKIRCGMPTRCTMPPALASRAQPWLVLRLCELHSDKPSGFGFFYYLRYLF